VVDKHSTGGVGDKVSLVLAPIAAACGCFVPMVSGRGLGHSGGTLDKMDSIPGYRSKPDLASFKRVVKATGCAIIGQTDAIAPADRRLYAIRDVTGTVESVPLITASILSKKIAEGSEALVMDVKTGSGAFMATLGQARELASSIIATAGHIGLKVSALITDMSEVLGYSAGNAVEVAEAVQYLTSDRREPRLDRGGSGCQLARPRPPKSNPWRGPLGYSMAKDRPSFTPEERKIEPGSACDRAFLSAKQAEFRRSCKDFKPSPHPDGLMVQAPAKATC